MPPEMDKIGVWSEVKLAIIRDYMPAYSKPSPATTFITFTSTDSQDMG